MRTCSHAYPSLVFDRDEDDRSCVRVQCSLVTHLFCVCGHRYLLASALNPAGEPRASALLTQQTLDASIERTTVPRGLETVLPEDCRSPTVLLEGSDSGDAITMVQLLARSRHRVVRVVRAGHIDARQLVIDAFVAAAGEGCWLMVAHVDLDPPGFDRLLARLSSTETRVHEEFRLFVSQIASTTLWPTSVVLTE